MCTGASAEARGIPALGQNHSTPIWFPQMALKGANLQYFEKCYIYLESCNQDLLGKNDISLKVPNVTGSLAEESPSRC